MRTEVAVLLYEIGKDCFQKDQIGHSVVWLERCFNLFERCQLEVLDDDAKELKLRTLHLISEGSSVVLT